MVFTGWPLLNWGYKRDLSFSRELKTAANKGWKESGDLLAFDDRFDRGQVSIAADNYITHHHDARTHTNGHATA